MEQFTPLFVTLAIVLVVVESVPSVIDTKQLVSIASSSFSKPQFIACIEHVRRNYTATIANHAKSFQKGGLVKENESDPKMTLELQKPDVNAWKGDQVQMQSKYFPSTVSLKNIAQVQMRYHQYNPV
jgi:hypothetical protein